MKMKKWLLPICVVLGLIALLVATAVVMSMMGYGMSVGKLYFTEDTVFLIDGNTSMMVSNQSQKSNLFDRYSNGDTILLFHDGVEETFPARTGGYMAFRISKSDGTYQPSGELLGIAILSPTEGMDDKDLHTHMTALTPQTVDDPVTGYCGNTWTTLYIDGKVYRFMYGYSVALTDLLVNLNYNPDKVCRCMAQYVADTEFGTKYQIHLDYGFVRCDLGQADLTQEQIQTIAEIIEWAETTDCCYPAGILARNP